MSIRRAVLVPASILLGAALIWLLIRLGKVDLRETLRQVEHVSLIGFVGLALLNGALVAFSTLKWRSVDAALRRPADCVPSKVTAFSMSSAGMALGLVLPVFLGMTTARTAGTHPYGRTLKRGTGGTLFEQSFDLLVVVLLGVASAITWLCHGGPATWAACAFAVLAIPLAAARPSLWFVQQLFHHAETGMKRLFSSRLSRPPSGFLVRMADGFFEAQRSDLANVRLVRRLLILSTARFGVVVLMACQTAAMIGAHIAFWRMAAAIPFTAISNLFAVTPGGLGVNELTSVTALHLFGTPLAVASQWALANRILATAACFFVTACALAAFGFEKVLSSGATGLSGTGKESVE